VEGTVIDAAQFDHLTNVYVLGRFALEKKRQPRVNIGISVSELHIGGQMDITEATRARLPHIKLVLYNGAYLDLCKGQTELTVDMDEMYPDPDELDLQELLMDGAFKSIVAHGGKGIGTPERWKDIAFEAGTVKRTQSPVELDLKWSRTASAGFLASRTYSALDYKRLEVIGLYVTDLPFCGSTARFALFMEALSRGAPKLRTVHLVGDTFCTRAFTAVIGAMMTRFIRADEKNASRSDVHLMYYLPRDEILKPGKAREALTKLRSLFSRSTSASRLQLLQSDPACLKAYVSLATWLCASSASSRVEQLQRAITASPEQAHLVTAALGNLFGVSDGKIASEDIGNYITTVPGLTSATEQTFAVLAPGCVQVLGRVSVTFLQPKP
jgi:hypothetical protein